MVRLSFRAKLLSLTAAIGLAATLAMSPSAAQDQSEPNSAQDAPPEATLADMTLTRLDELIRRLDEAAVTNGQSWQFAIEDVTVIMVADPVANRMRLMVAIKPSVDLSQEELLRLSQANFDTALDARYAVGQNILWATFIHPLRELHDSQFIEAVGQTVNAARSYGTTYSSGLLTYGGGDSNSILQRELIDDLLRRGEEI